MTINFCPASYKFNAELTNNRFFSSTAAAAAGGGVGGWSIPELFFDSICRKVGKKYQYWIFRFFVFFRARADLMNAYKLVII